MPPPALPFGTSLDMLVCPPPWKRPRLGVYGERLGAAMSAQPGRLPSPSGQRASSLGAGTAHLPATFQMGGLGANGGVPANVAGQATLTAAGGSVPFVGAVSPASLVEFQPSLLLSAGVSGGGAVAVWTSRGRGGPQRSEAELPEPRSPPAPLGPLRGRLRPDIVSGRSEGDPTRPAAPRTCQPACRGSADVCTAIVPFLDLPGAICRNSCEPEDPDVDVYPDRGGHGGLEGGRRADEAEELIMEAEEEDATMDSMDCS